MSRDLASHPTRIAELIPDPILHNKGACDAEGVGMGDVHFVPSEDISIIPLLWWQQFPMWIQNCLVSFANPDGNITNSDLELAGSIAPNNINILAWAADVTKKTTHNCYNNVAAVFWQQKGATTTLDPTAFLLRLQAFHQRFFFYIPLCDYIPGPQNLLANFCCIIGISPTTNCFPILILIFHRSSPGAHASFGPR